jgi:hypothetical protein
MLSTHNPNVVGGYGQGNYPGDRATPDHARGSGPPRTHGVEPIEYHHPSTSDASARLYRLSILRSIRSKTSGGAPRALA